MHKSLVIQSALKAFEDAKFRPAAQQIFAKQMGFDVKLFDDIYKTLIAVEKADDIFVSASGKILRNDFALSTPVYMEWLEAYPNGVVWPITMAAAADAGKHAAPMSVLMMVPLHNASGNFDIPIALTQHKARETWGNHEAEALGTTASLILGMYADAKGQWMFSPAISWTFAFDAQTTISKPLPVLPRVISFFAESTGIDFDEAAKEYMRDFTFAEIGCVVLSKK